MRRRPDAVSAKGNMTRLAPELLELLLLLLPFVSTTTVWFGPFPLIVDVMAVPRVVVGVTGDRACDVVPLEGFTATKVVATGTGVGSGE
jgi:hypothetical protein